jgi:BirA family biotin operon repressor/biotin-[acetyl-CoA-carboxylase] ligase
MPAFDSTRAVALLQERGLALGRPLEYRAVTGSTNDDAMAAARAGAPHGATFVADEQTKGRGRRGHRWSAAPGDDLTFSLLLRPRLELERLSALTLAAGLAVRDAIAPRIEAPVSVKWPNDVFVSGRKLAGILVESQLAAGKLSAVVVGVGLNVGTRELPEEIRDSATSLSLLGAADPGREVLLVDLLEALGARVESYERAGLEPMLDELRRHDALRGRRVRIEGVAGSAQGVDRDGALVVEDDAGTRHRILSGTVETF